MTDHTFEKDFKYTHQNPYHDKLEEFSEFVMRDGEAELFQNRWNSEVFKRSGTLEVEIGSGFGHFMLEHTAKFPNVNFVGLDYRFKRSFQLAKKLSKHPHKNFRYLRARGERIEYMFAPGEIDNLFYFFPDPWPKNRHHKKRLFQSPFLQSVKKVLNPSGTFYVKTDHDGYFEWMLAELAKSQIFEIKMQTTDLYQEFPEHFLASFQTKFEKIFLAKQVKIKALELKLAKGQ